MPSDFISLLSSDIDPSSPKSLYSKGKDVFVYYSVFFIPLCKSAFMLTAVRNCETLLTSDSAWGEHALALCVYVCMCVWVSISVCVRLSFPFLVFLWKQCNSKHEVLSDVPCVKLKFTRLHGNGDWYFISYSIYACIWSQEASDCDVI